MDDSSWWWNHNCHFRTMVTVMVTVMMRGRMVRMVMVRMVMVMIMTYVMCNVSPHCSMFRLVMLLISFSL